MNESSKRALGLSRHLAPMVSPDRQLKMAGTERSERLARAILADPQAHVDALVAAGVLHIHHEGRGAGKKRRLNYTRNPAIHRPPHQHDWQVVAFDRAGPLELWCGGCNRSEMVPNQVPIEAPK